MKNDEKFISRITDETYAQTLSSVSNNSTSLQGYFEAKIRPSKKNKFLMSRGIHSLPLINHISFYRISYKGKIYDFPKNWGPFSKLHLLERQKVKSIHISETEDKDSFLEVFNPFSIEQKGISFCQFDEELRILFLTEIAEFKWIDYHLNEDSLIDQKAA